MKRETFRQFIILECDSAQEFQEKLNLAMREHATKHPEVEFNKNKGHSAYISWTEEVTIVESIADEFAMKGIRYVCGECPFFELSKDKRVKYTTCGCDVKNTYYERPACESLYEKIKRGEIVL